MTPPISPISAGRLATSTLQQLGELPAVTASSAEFAALLAPPPADDAMDDAVMGATDGAVMGGADAEMGGANDVALPPQLPPQSASSAAVATSDVHDLREASWRAMAAASLAPRHHLPQGAAEALLDTMRSASLASPTAAPPPTSPPPPPLSPSFGQPSRPPQPPTPLPPATQRARAVGLLLWHFFQARCHLPEHPMSTL